MTPRKQRFIEEYARLRNGKAAALAAGYGERCAAPMASKMLRRGDVQEALIARGVELAFSTYGVKPATRIAPFLTVRQERFVEHYLILGKGAEAARRAGYSARSAGNRADRLLNTPRVAAAIAEARAERAARMRIDGDHVLAEYASLAFIELGMIADWGPEGVTLKRADELAREDRAAIAEITEHRGKSGARLRIKLFDKPRALAALAKHLGLFEKGARDAAARQEKQGEEARQILRERLRRLIASARGDKAKKE